MTEQSKIEGALRERASDVCELCATAEDLRVFPVPPGDTTLVERCVLTCALCVENIGAETFDSKHWNCLRESAWSQEPAVQVLCHRLLTRLQGEGESWAGELLDQLYLDDETLAWAQEGDGDGGGEQEAERAPTLDSNGTPLADGDAVTLIKDLDVKGANFVAKRGTMVKNIRLTDDPGHVEGRVNKVGIVLKTAFLKKVV